MAKANAKFYSMKYGDEKTIKSHITKDAAVKKARDFGMIYDTHLKQESQVHAMSDNTLKAFVAGSHGHHPMNKSFHTYLIEKKLILENQTQ